MDGGTKSCQPEKDPTGPIDKQLPPDIRSVGLTLQAVLVEHTPRMGYGTDQQERNTKAVEAVGRQHPEPDAEDERAHARGELSQLLAAWLGDGHSRLP
jgi:hypothetical protein